MTNFRVTYRGPSSFAVRAAALLADTDGVELTSATRADVEDPSDGTVLLVLTVAATAEAVSAALAAVRAELPADATVFGEEPVGG
ncbi:MAG TPA: hypothetical protein VHT97_14090 [Acidimicrobiales bacterium]|nr:hypothetical protein [Acidimicrobiales bacterium]